METALNGAMTGVLITAVVIAIFYTGSEIVGWWIERRARLQSDIERARLKQQYARKQKRRS